LLDSTFKRSNKSNIHPTTYLFSLNRYTVQQNKIVEAATKMTHLYQNVSDTNFYGKTKYIWKIFAGTNIFAKQNYVKFRETCTYFVFIAFRENEKSIFLSTLSGKVI
jgi:hypothetical protein